jgi:N-acetylglutamate synthase-like GNAT family acetyltransferase
LREPQQRYCDTLLARRNNEIIGLAQMVRRTMQYGSVSCPVALVRLLRVAPEYQQSELPKALLGEMEKHALSNKVPAGFCWTTDPHFFEAAGWVRIDRPRPVVVQIANLLRDLDQWDLLRGAERRHPWEIRPARKFDLKELATCYENASKNCYGSLCRSADCWDWLLDVRPFEQIYLALPRPRRRRKATADLTSFHPPVVGYYVRRGKRIVELFHLPTAPRAGLALVVHLCREAMERGHTWIELDLLPDSELRFLIQATEAVKPVSETQQDLVLLAKIWDPREFLARVAPQLLLRYQCRSCQHSFSLGLAIGGRQIRLTTNSSQSLDISCGLPNDFLEVAPSQVPGLFLPTLPRLTLKNNESANSNGDSVVRASSAEALRLAKFLFTPVPFWQSQLDHPLSTDSPAGARTFGDHGAKNAAWPALPHH